MTPGLVVCVIESSKNIRTNINKERVVLVRWTPHPVIVTIRDHGNYIRVPVYSFDYRVGVLLKY